MPPFVGAGGSNNYMPSIPWDSLPLARQEPKPREYIFPRKHGFVQLQHTEAQIGIRNSIQPLIQQLVSGIAMHTLSSLLNGRMDG